MPILYLSLGSNIGDKNLNLNKAIELIKERIGKFISLSAFYSTPPWGFESENEFLNAALALETDLPVEGVLVVTQIIEKEIGRTAKTDGCYADRVIDIDLLFYDQLVIKTRNLELPHPYLHDRLFVLEPLSEIASDFVHPILNKTINQLLIELKQNDKNN